MEITHGKVTGPPPSARTNCDTPTGHRRNVLVRRVRLLVAATITYNILEATVALLAGVAASSTALIAFGLDSIIEVSSAVALGWQFSGRDHPARQAREQRTLRAIAVSFFALAAYVTVSATADLLTGRTPDTSTVGLVLAATSLALMPVLSRWQRRAGRELHSRSAIADSRQTMLCSYLSAALLIGLGAHSLVGWTWADSVAALVIAAIAVKEGRTAWRGDPCC